MNPAAVLQKWGFERWIAFGIAPTYGIPGSGTPGINEWRGAVDGKLVTVQAADAFDFATDLLRRN